MGFTRHEECFLGMVSKEFAAVKMVILRIAGLGAPHRSDLIIVVICPEEDLVKLLNEYGCGGVFHQQEIGNFTARKGIYLGLGPRFPVYFCPGYGCVQTWGAQEAPRLGRFESKEQHADRGKRNLGVD